MIPVAMSVLERTVSMTTAEISMMGSMSVGGGGAVVVVVVVIVGGSGGGGVDGLWPKRDANGMESRAEDDVGVPRIPGRGGRGGLVGLEGSGSAALNAEIANEG